MRTLKEKVKYNKERKTEFSQGYTLGVTMYSEYVRQNAEGKATINSIVAQSKAMAKDGDQWGKGVMCGMRDAGRERKKKHKEK